MPGRKGHTRQRLHAALVRLRFLQALSEEEHILEFLRQHLNEIIKDTTAEMYANSIRVAMNKQGITSMKVTLA